MTDNRDGALLWILLLSAASVGTSWAFACAAPVAALAALAATRMSKRDGIALMLVAWVASQAVGFMIHHYPRDPKTLLWGVAIGTAGIASLVAAREACARFADRPVARLVLAFIAASFGYKGALAVWSLGLGGVGIALSPFYFAKGFARDGAILIGLLLLYRGLLAIGLPGAGRARLATA